MVTHDSVDWVVEDEDEDTISEAKGESRHKLCLVGGVDISFAPDNASGVAALVILRFPDLQLVCN